jgi:hypothetical protein
MTNLPFSPDALPPEKREKWNRGLDLFIESVLKPDYDLRMEAHNQECLEELMQIRQTVLEYLKEFRLL